MCSACVVHLNGLNFKFKEIKVSSFEKPCFTCKFVSTHILILIDFLYYVLNPQQWVDFGSVKTEVVFLIGHTFNKCDLTKVKGKY